jgi:biopolymer transport protein TolR
MAIAVGNEAGGLSHEPNVIPMIDILLVLLIIFMIIQPMMRKAIDLQLPDPTPQAAPPSVANPDQIVLEIGPNMVMSINKEPVSKDRLASRMKEIYDPRPSKVLFVKADGSNKYQDVIWAMDVARGSGVKVIGVPPKDAGK